MTCQSHSAQKRSRICARSQMNPIAIQGLDSPNKRLDQGAYYGTWHASPRKGSPKGVVPSHLHAIHTPSSSLLFAPIQSRNSYSAVACSLGRLIPRSSLLRCVQATRRFGSNRDCLHDTPSSRSSASLQALSDDGCRLQTHRNTSMVECVHVWPGNGHFQFTHISVAICPFPQPTTRPSAFLP